MNQEHKQLITELVTLPHFHALKAVLDERIARMKDVTEIDRANPNFTAIAMGKSIAAETIHELLIDIGLYEGTGESKRKTYE